MTGSVNITVPFATFGTGSLADSYLIAAQCLLSGVGPLAKDPKTGHACAFLAAQTLECALKAYLAKVGITDSELKDRKRRHNLEVLWREAVSHGLSIQAEPAQWCLILNSAHDQPHYYIRYPIGINMVTLPDLVPMVLELGELVAAVARAVQIR